MNIYYESIGLEAINKEELVNNIIININNINDKLKTENLELIDDQLYVTTDNYILQGGQTYTRYYWWGAQHYLSTRAAYDYSSRIRMASHANAATALIAGAVFGGIGALPNGLTSIYGYNLADRVDYRNSRTARGIIVSVHYVLTFDIKNQ